MLVYTKIVDGVRKLYGTMGRLPGEEDEELVYVDRDIEDESEEIVEPVEKDKYFATNGYTIQRASNNRTKYFDVYVVDKDNDDELVNIIPGGREAPSLKELVKIEVNSDDVKKDYDITEGLDLTGIKVTATFKDTESGKESTKDVSDKVTSVPAKGEKFSEEGVVTVTITFKDKTDSFEVNVVDKSKVNIYFDCLDHIPASLDEVSFERENANELLQAGKISKLLPDDAFGYVTVAVPKAKMKITNVYLDDSEVSSWSDFVIIDNEEYQFAHTTNETGFGEDTVYNFIIKPAD